MVIVTHEMEFARDVSDRVIFLRIKVSLLKKEPLKIFLSIQKKLGQKEFLHRILTKNYSKRGSHSG